MNSHASNTATRAVLHKAPNIPRYRFACEIAGREYRGTYWIAGKIMTVSTGLGGKSKLVGKTEPEVLARELLIELAKEGKA